MHDSAQSEVGGLRGQAFKVLLGAIPGVPKVQTWLALLQATLNKFASLETVDLLSQPQGHNFVPKAPSLYLNLKL